MEKELTSAMIWSLFDSLHEGVLIAETNGTILYLNDTAGDLLNLAPEAASLQAAAKLFTPPQSWKDCLNPPFKTTISEGNGRILTLHSRLIDFNQTNLIQLIISPQSAKADLDSSTQALQQLSTLTRVSNETDLHAQLTLLVNGLQKTGWNRVVLSLRDESFNPTMMIAAGITPAEETFLRNNAIPAQA